MSRQNPTANTNSPTVNNSRPWSLYLTLSLVVLSLGGGGIATLLSLFSAEIPANAQYAVIVLTSLSAVALSGFIIHGLQGIKTRGEQLLNEIAPLGTINNFARTQAELKFGSDLRASRLAQYSGPLV